MECVNMFCRIVRVHFDLRSVYRIVSSGLPNVTQGPLCETTHPGEFGVTLHRYVPFLLPTMCTTLSNRAYLVLRRTRESL